jgi:hypothetical protein
MPKNAVVPSVWQLFTREQMAQLALLKSIIKKIKDKNIRISLMLAFYNTVTIINKTFHETPHGGGNHFGYYYRYRIATKPAVRDMIKVFENKYKRILDAKKDIEMQCLLNTQKTVEDMLANAQIIKGTATDLSFLEKESVDYIYTDPPYGTKIQYLDLSVMWNAWLDLEVTEQDYKLEAIEVDGSLEKTKDEYKKLIAKSIEEMFRVLKFDRWMSFVFAHKDPEYWHLIVETCERCGFEYRGAVSQPNGQTSFKKRQNPFTVLSGQLIINFYKAHTPRAIMKAHLGMNISEIVMQTIEGVIARDDGATLEQINNELIMKGLELGFLGQLKKEYSDLTDILLNNFNYDEKNDRFTIKKGRKFQTNVDIKLRVKYYVIDFLRRMEHERKEATFDEIVRDVLPLLKNGVTPEEQTILSVLEDIAERTPRGGWRLHSGNPMLFD